MWTLIVLERSEYFASMQITFLIGCHGLLVELGHSCLQFLYSSNINLATFQVMCKIFKQLDMK